VSDSINFVVVLALCVLGCFGVLTAAVMICLAALALLRGNVPGAMVVAAIAFVFARGGAAVMRLAARVIRF
jgi:hypothetical protein